MTVVDSPLRRVDARGKLLLALGLACAAMLPLQPLAMVSAAFALLVVGTGLAAVAAAALRRTAPFLALLFALDWLCIGFPFAVLITLRLTLLATSGVVLSATTTPEELCAALERLRLSRRAAFALSSAFRSADLLADEWRGIAEAQRARGLPPPPTGWRAWRAHGARLVAYFVPAIVLATQRAWALSEAAAVRGLETPRRGKPSDR